MLDRRSVDRSARFGCGLPVGSLENERLFLPTYPAPSKLALFHNRPTLAPEPLVEALQAELPDYSEVRLESAELSQVVPTEYHADPVVLLLDGEPVAGIVVEVQLGRDVG